MSTCRPPALLQAPPYVHDTPSMWHVWADLFGQNLQMASEEANTESQQAW